MSVDRIAILGSDSVAYELARLVRNADVLQFDSVAALVESGADEILLTHSREALRAVEAVSAHPSPPSLTLLVAPPEQEHPHAELLRKLSLGKREWEVTFDAIVDPLALLDEHGNVLRPNLGLARAVGRSVQEIMGVPYASLLGPAVPVARDPIAQSLADGAARTEEARYTLIPGLQQVTVSPLGAEAGRGFVVLMKDLSEQKAQQERLQRAARLVDIGQLAAGIAHEINTPLASIALRAESLLRSAQDPRLAEVEAFRNFPRYLKTIEEETFRCKKIIAGLLEFSSSRKVEVRPVDLNGLAQKAADLLGHQMQLKQVSLSVELEPGLPPVPADEGQIRQVLVALLMNALDATTPGGHVWVETRSEPAGRVSLSIRDNGAGIPPALLDEIFTPFFTTKPPGQGTGLGLAICHGIVTSYGGEIRVQSIPGSGTRLSVLLPVRARS